MDETVAVVLSRARELANDGKFRSLDQLTNQLKEEQFKGVDVILQDVEFRRHLRQIAQSARRS